MIYLRLIVCTEIYQRLLFCIVQFFPNQSYSCLKFFCRWKQTHLIHNIYIIIRRHSHRSMDSSECPPHICFVFITAYQQPYCWIVIRTFQQFINCADIIIQLAGILRFNCLHKLS